jgi:uncharacterized membrane protein
MGDFEVKEKEVGEVKITDQKRLREKKRRKKNRNLFIFCLVIHLIINSCIWGIFYVFGVSILKRENILIFIFIFIFSFIGILFLYNYIHKKMLEKERKRSDYRFR